MKNLLNRLGDTIVVQGLSDLWSALVDCIERFLDNRFRDKFEDEREFLKMEIEKVRAEKDELLQHILKLSEPHQEDEIDLKAVAPIGVQPVFWKQRCAQLEKEDRIRAQKLREDKKSTEQLEDELLGDKKNG